MKTLPVTALLTALLTLGSPLLAHAFPTYATGGFRGSDLMTSEEVKAHVGKLLAVQTLQECQAYMDAHEAELQKRAQEKHITLPEKGGDPCKVMRFMGRIK